MSGFDPERFMDYASREGSGHGAALGIRLSCAWRGLGGARSALAG